MGNGGSWNFPDDVELRPIHPRVLDKMAKRGIHEGHVLELFYDDPDMVAVPIRRGRKKAPTGSRPYFLMGRSSRGALEVGANYDPRNNSITIFHVNVLQNKHRARYKELREKL